MHAERPALLLSRSIIDLRVMDLAFFDRWLRQYGSAWERRDAESAADLFATDSVYYWTPFAQPKQGRSAITAAWRDATSRQKDVEFKYEIVSVGLTYGLARWWCRFTRAATGKRVRLEGVLMAVFDSSGLCREFREWWHSDEVL